MNGKPVLCTTLVKEQTDLSLAILEHISKEDLLHISSDSAGLWTCFVVPAKSVFLL